MFSLRLRPGEESRALGGGVVSIVGQQSIFASFLHYLLELEVEPGACVGFTILFAFDF